MKSFYVIIAALILFIIGVQVGIRHGKEMGYSDGWSDAHCGTEITCEGGQQ